MNAKAMPGISMSIFGTPGIFAKTRSIDPLTAALISVTILGETMSMRQATGGILSLGFTF